MTTGAPLRQDSARPRSLISGSVELPGIEQARSGCTDRRRGIDSNDVVLGLGPLQEAASVVDHYVRSGRAEQFLGIRVEVRKKGRNAGHEVHYCRIDSPREH